MESDNNKQVSLKDIRHVYGSISVKNEMFGNDIEVYCDLVSMRDLPEHVIKMLANFIASDYGNLMNEDNKFIMLMRAFYVIPIGDRIIDSILERSRRKADVPATVIEMVNSMKTVSEPHIDFEDDGTMASNGTVLIVSVAEENSDETSIYGVMQRSEHSFEYLNSISNYDAGELKEHVVLKHILDYNP